MAFDERSLHSLLAQQLHETGLSLTDASLSEQILSLLALVNRSYHLLEEKHQIEKEREYTSRMEKLAAEKASQAKTQYLANVSHELRTPLHAIIGYSELLEESCEALEDKTFKEDVKKIRISGEHLLNLIDDVLDISKIETGKMELVFRTLSVKTILDDIISTVRPLIEKNDNQLNLQLPAMLGDMSVDKMKLKQILYNLLSNAAKFTRKGTIQLTVKREHLMNVDWMVFIISDTGIGIDKEKIPLLFKPFSQIETLEKSEVQVGTGLGLSISKRFCCMMGGDIFVESEPKKGSTFTVKLPCEKTGKKEMKLEPLHRAYETMD